MFTTVVEVVGAVVEPEAWLPSSAGSGGGDGVGSGTPPSAS